ncbi:MAG: RHS repeat-associated core domain-containing protein [Caldilineaceae bacterium]
MGVFLSADPFVQAPENMQNLNRYSYVLNNPLSYTDPSGFMFKEVGRVGEGCCRLGEGQRWRTIVTAAVACFADSCVRRASDDGRSRRRRVGGFCGRLHRHTALRRESW